MKKESEYAHVLRGLADGETIQFSWFMVNKWEDMKEEDVLSSIAEAQWKPECYRIKPRTININGHEVPEPMRVEPNSDESYFVPNLIEDHPFTHFTWNGNRIDKKWLVLGVCHTTKEAAIAHAKALLSFTEVK